MSIIYYQPRRVSVGRTWLTFIRKSNFIKPENDLVVTVLFAIKVKILKMIYKGKKLLKANVEGSTNFWRSDDLLSIFR